MTNMTAEQRENADDMMEGTMITWAGMWDAINRYAETVDMPKLHWSASLAQTAIQQVSSNVVVNDLANNPAKYTLEQIGSALAGTAITATGVFISNAHPAGIVLSVAFGAIGGSGFGNMMDEAYQHWPAYRTWVDGLNNPFDPNTDIVPQPIKDFFNELAVAASKAVQKYAAEIETSLTKTAQDIENVAKQVWEDTVNTLKSTQAWVQNNITDILAKTSDFLSDFWEGFKEIMADILNFAEGVSVASSLAVIQGVITQGVVKAIAEYFTPIAFDLNGSGGINTYSSTSSLNKAFFDMDNDMFREKVQWLNPVDGWLAMDRNEDGLITNQRELFGDSDGKLAYQKLAELNTNNTGSSANAITSADTAWGNLRVWIDADIDGISDAGELKTLDSLAITSISLETTPKKGTFAMNDNIPLLFPYFLVA